LEIVDLALASRKISIARKMFEPDRILFQSAQTEPSIAVAPKNCRHPADIRREPAAEETVTRAE